jgi:hypothetical protein
MVSHLFGQTHPISASYKLHSLAAQVLGTCEYYRAKTRYWLNDGQVRRMLHHVYPAEVSENDWREFLDTMDDIAKYGNKSHEEIMAILRIRAGW